MDLIPLFLQKLSDPSLKTVFIVGCGGGFDFVHSNLIISDLKKLNKKIIIGSYSFGSVHNISKAPIVWQENELINDLSVFENENKLGEKKVLNSVVLRLTNVETDVNKFVHLQIFKKLNNINNNDDNNDNGDENENEKFIFEMRWGRGFSLIEFD